MSSESSATRGNERPASGPEYDAIQGMIVNGYRGYDFIRFLIFTIPAANVAAVRVLCGALIPGTAGSPMTVTAATRWSANSERPPYRLNFAVTKTGLQKLISVANFTAVYNKSYQVMSPFSRASSGGGPLGTTNPYGAADPGTALTVGDTGPSAPPNWWQTGGWQLPGEQPAQTDLDLLFALYAPSAEARERWGQQLLTMIGADSAVLAFQQDSDPLDPAGQTIHFGYRDGISQPRIAGFSEADPELDDRPSVDAWNFIIQPTGAASASRPTYSAHPLLANGCFAAFRMLYQDVEKFEAFIHQQGGSPEEAERIAAKMCGRWRDGTPLETSPERPRNQRLLGAPLKGEYHLNNFDYIGTSAHQQPKPAPFGNPDLGQACPYAAHIRRSNPRDDGSVLGNNDGSRTLMAAQHRILRRARPYGPSYDSAKPGSGSQQRGLIGLFLGADLSNQFEFLMQTWITQGGFSPNDASPNDGGYDPLFGPPPAAQSDNTTELAYCPGSPGDPSNTSAYTVLPGLPQLVVTVGALYVFLPGIPALHYFATGTIPS
jgi:deferrochelatase/peroxidase EfeB